MCKEGSSETYGGFIVDISLGGDVDCNVVWHCLGFICIELSLIVTPSTNTARQCRVF